MALDETYAKGSSVNNTNHATFIPKLWSDEIIAEYEKSLVMKPLVKSMKMTGKKGDTINIPMPVRGEANAKVEETQVTLVADTSSNKQILIDQHWEYSRLIEDITAFRRCLQCVSSTLRTLVMPWLLRLTVIWLPMHWLAGPVGSHD
jgi:hypothetical protein